MRYNKEQIIETIKIIIPQEACGKRIDHVLAEILDKQTRSNIQKLIAEGLITVDNKTIKPSLKVKGNEEVIIEIPEAIEMSTQPENIPLEILYEDKDIIVINKPAGIVTHPSPGHENKTLVNALLYHCGDLAGIGGVLRPGIVHRLDKDTSGCLIAAKNDQSHQKLMEQFANRRIKKTYLAITDGVPRPLEGKIEGKIGRHPIHRQRQAMLKSGGRYSLTYYKTIENFGTIALVECDLQTGRTHQIRVHLKAIGTPIIADSEYGRQSCITENDIKNAGEILKKGHKFAKKILNNDDTQKIIIKRQALHAWKLDFNHPTTNENICCQAKIPNDMQNMLDNLRGMNI